MHFGTKGILNSGFDWIQKKKCVNKKKKGYLGTEVTQNNYSVHLKYLEILDSCRIHLSQVAHYNYQFYT